MADRPKNPQPFSDATEVSADRREDTAVDEPHGLTDAEPTDVGAPPSAAQTEDRSALATQPDRTPAAIAPEDRQQTPAPLPPEFDTENAPASEFAEATVQLPTFGRGGEDAPPSRFADATVSLEVQLPQRRASTSPPRGARRLPADVETSRSKRTMGEEESAQNVRRLQAPRPPTFTAEPDTDSREDSIDFAQLPSFEDDDDIYAQPTEALTFRDDAPSVDTARPSAAGAPKPLANEPPTDEKSAAGLGAGVPSSWIPSNLGPQSLSEEPDTDQSQDGFPSSWIPDSSPPDSARRIPSEILAEAGQTMTRAEQAEKNRAGPPVPVPLPLADNSKNQRVDAAAVDPLAAALPAKQETGTWNPGAGDSAFVPETAVSAGTHATPSPAALPGPASDVKPPSAPETSPPPPGATHANPEEEQPTKKGGCAVVAGAGCLFFLLASVVTGGIWFWSEQHRSAETPAKAPDTSTAAPTKTGASSPPNVGTAKTAPEAPKAQVADAPEDAPSEGPSEVVSGLEDDDVETPRQKKIRRRGTGTFVFRPTGGKRSQRLAFYAALRGALKDQAVSLAAVPVKRGYDVVGKVRGSRIDDDGDGLKIETDCRLAVREQPSGKRIRTISGTGVAKGPSTDRKALMRQAISACGRDLIKDIIPVLSGG